MRCQHCGSEVEKTWTLPFDPSGVEISVCECYVKQVFDAVAKHYGEDEARRIFSPYGKRRTKREIKLENDAELLWAYYLECEEAEQSKRKPNVRQLARQLAKENNIDPGGLERKLWRVINDPRVRRYVSRL